VALPGDLDVHSCAALRGESGPAWLLLDGYHFDREYMAALQQTGTRVCVVDDLADRAFFPAQIVVNPNCYAHRLHYDGPPGLQTLLGGRYVMLREEFLAMDRHPPAQAARPGRNLLVTMGGGEASQALLEVLDILPLAGVDDLSVHVVAGFACERREELLRSAEAQPYACRVSFAVENMAPLLSWAHATVSAAGGSVWEMAYAGVPAALTVLADNQRLIAAELAAAGAALALGRSPGLDPRRASRIVHRLMTDQTLRKALIDAGQGLVDGCGPARIVAAMEEYGHA
jgi:spore coat polysaccharide biosynthesis predicted glycosyltransferase SpsG